MSSKNELFASSSSEADTDDLIAAAKSQPIAKKKTSTTTASKSGKSMQQPDADNDSDDDDDDFNSNNNDDDDEEGGLFDSSSDEEEAPKRKKVTKKKKKKLSSTTAASPKKKKVGRKERMEELAKKKRQAAAASSGGGGKEPRRKRSKTNKNNDTTANNKEDDKGYDSGDSYNSTTFARTKEDDDFIDADDEDPDALKELYAEQHFDDERPEGYDSEEEAKLKKEAAAKKKGRKRTSTGGGGIDKISLSDDEEGGTPSASTALKDAVRRMQKKKREVKKLPQLEAEASQFLQLMDGAADADDESIAAKRPALKKLGMLSTVMEMLAQKDIQRVLLDMDLLMVCKRWVQPLPPDGKTLGNVTVRRRIMESLSQMTGESGISSQDLKRSGFGKVVMALYKHPKETPEMKKMCKAMIEQWSRPIFQKSGNMRDLERAQRVRGMNEMGSLVGIARQQQQQPSKARVMAGGRAKDEDDLAQIIHTGSKNTTDIGNNRVRVPYSKGFQFSVRPADRTGDVSDKRNLVSAKAARSSMGREGDTKDSLQKRMLSKARPVNKQSQRSANISIEGRAVK